MNPATFQFLAGIVKERSGGVLTADQAYMLDTRLASLLKREGLPNLDALAMKLRSPLASNLAQEMTELLTTNESHFFRDGKPFDYLRAVLPELHKARAPGLPIRIWSAACSTGQEAYSIAIIINELQDAGDAGWKTRRFEIFGTDLTKAVVDRAREGIFTQFEVQRGLPVRQLMKHFQQVEGRWRAQDRLRNLMRFQQANLLHDLRGFGKFDLIFCRNVLIYFDLPTKARVLNALAGQLAPDGALFLGAAETAMGITDRLEPIGGQRGIYHAAAAAGQVRARA
ncbi:chemotaxis protein CheR [Rhodovarius crocodyli]|uniref:protein-glutamate O-methyltransferase n=1 Tax=Rhodovarius crocodyli TaxID=1979269 RepID=A0A437MIH6_9PROT|nr:CheR family methyltransferase [Rhodovarius crocodyli]RVT97435.1 chemotaxis protein CheR [Rhodovarius crocodyli]